MASSPSPSDRRYGPRATALRATIAVLALYAFVLQAFLGGLMPIPAAADGLCAQHAASDAAPGKALPHDHGDCCTATQTAATALPARAAAAVIAWETATASDPAWAMADGPRARAPPGGIASPRGPPAA